MRVITMFKGSASAVLAVGFALGYLLSAWFAPLPLKVDSFLTGSVLNASPTDVALSAAVLAAALGVLVLGGRYLAFYCLDAVGYRAAGLSPRAAERTLLVLICLTVGVLVPAVGSILPVALVAAPAAAVRPWARTVRGMLAGSAAAGTGCCLAGLWAALALEISAGGTMVVVCGLAYAASALAARRRQRQ